MIKVVFFPPIADSIRKVEHCITWVDGYSEVANLIECLRAEPLFERYFECVSQYCSSGKLVENLLVVVNESVADESSQVKDGDLVSILLPFAGG